MGDFGGSVVGSPDAGASGSGPGDAPTGQRWEPVETDNGCGRNGIGYVLVDEVCGKSGEGYETPGLQAPMFRDGALFGQTLLAVDATFLWSLDLSAPGGITYGAGIDVSPNGVAKVFAPAAPPGGTVVGGRTCYGATASCTWR